MLQEQINRETWYWRLTRCPSPEKEPIENVGIIYLKPRNCKKSCASDSFSNV